MQYFHGGKNGNLKELNTDHGGDGFVYATSSRLVALTYAARTYPNLFSFSNGKECFWELKPNLFEKMTKNKSGYIYRSACKDFEPIPQSKRCGHKDCYRLDEDVKVFDSEFVEDVYKELMKYAQMGEFEIIRENEMSLEKKISMTKEMASIARSLDEKVLNNKNYFWKMFLDDKFVR